MSASPSQRAMLTALVRLQRGEGLGAALMTETMREIMAGACEPAQIGALLMGLSQRRELLDEIVGAATAMREQVVRVPCSRHDLLDTCGTGGSGIARRNVSTAVALCVAACGHPVAKHGNRSAAGPCGSADVLECLGLRLDASAATVGACIDEVGVGFLFAPELHPAMRHAAPVRKALGIRTLFNLLGPLCNPAFATRQLLGVYDPARTRELAQALGQLGSTRVLVVHGFAEGVAADESAPWGIDDASPCGETLVWELHGGALGRRVVTPADAGLQPVPLSAIAGDSALHNAEALLRLLDGEPGPYRTAVAYSGALALLAAGDGPWSDLPRHARAIEAVLDDGRARTILAELVAQSHQSR